MTIKFLSNKRNLYGLLCLSYFLMGYMCTTMGLTITQLIFVCAVMGLGNFAQYLLGYSQGIVFTTSNRPQFIKELDKINELIRKENKKTSKTKKKKCVKCNRNDGTCGCANGGCSSGGCKNC